MKKSILGIFKLVKLLGKIFLPLIIILTPFFAIVALVSPKFFSKIIKLFFDQYIPIPPKEFLYTDSVQTFNNIRYGDQTDEILDIHLPNKKEGTYPLIIWAHGGAFVAGNKSYTTFFARVLAHFGYAVASINYTLAPTAQYPMAIMQVGRAHSFLVNGTYQGKEFVDTKRLFLAGDSAGAQIMAQFALLQTNPVYRRYFITAHPEISLPKVISPEELKGNLLYCGCFSIKDLQDTKKLPIRFLFWQVGWAYFGQRRIKNITALDEMDIVANVTADFPPSFIADGNTLTFPKQGRALSMALKKLNVPVITLVFDENNKKVYHEFQFNLETPEARQALLSTLAFLKKYSSKP